MTNGLKREQIGRVAAKYGKTPAQVILCHLLLRGISVIPKSNSEQRIIENFDCIFDMDDEDFRLIDNIGENVRNFDSLEYLGFDNYNGEVEEP